MHAMFFLNDWQVDASSNTLRQGKQQQQLEPKAMDVLLLLCQHAGEVLASEDIVSQCWPNTATGDNPLHKTITQLRKALGDSATNPRYIETIRKRGYRIVAEVRFPSGVEESAAAQSWQQGSPFPGLQAFDARFSSVFFGRGTQIDTLLQRITKQIQYGRDFCLVLGPSGSGKSSLINAGVMPNLMQPNGFNGIQVISYSSIDLADVVPAEWLIDFASAMLDWECNEQPVFTGESAQSLAAQLAATPSAVLQHCVAQLPKNTKNKPYFTLFIDRLEVLLASPLFNQADREHFTELLEQCVTCGGILVLSACRNEFYPELVSFPSLMAGKARGAHFDLAAPNRSELLQMIRLPALAAGLTFDIDSDTAMPLDEILCSEAASNPDALPMLQYTLQALYLQRSSDNQLLVSVYHALGGIEGAIGKNAEQAITALGSAEKASLPRVLSMLVTLREDEQSITSRSGRVQQLQTAGERNLVHAMIEHRLFVSHLQNDEPCFSIAHEALLRRWPRATAWINEHHQSLSVKSRLLHLTQRWQTEQQNSAYLLADGKPLQEAQTLLNNHLFSLDADEQRFIQASHAKARLKRWTKRSTIALLCLLTITAVSMSVRSFNAEQQAQQKRLAAENLLGFMVGDFADKLRSIGRMDLLDGISNKALEYFTDYTVDDSNLSIAARLQHGQTLEAMGEVAYSRGKTEEATAALQAARIQLEAVLAQQPDNLELLKTLGANAFWLGQIQYDVSNWSATQPEFERYYRYSEQMYQLAPDNIDAMMELSYATNSLGSLAMKQQRFETATQNFQESLRLKLLAQLANPDESRYRADIANARSWLASSAQALGNIKLAIQTHQQLQTELISNNNVSQEPYLLFRLAGSYQILADLLAYQGRISEAMATTELGYGALSKALEQDPDNKNWQKRKHYYFYQSFRFLTNLTAEQVVIKLKERVERVQAEDLLLSDTDKKEFLARHWLTSAEHLAAIEQFLESKKYADLASTALSELMLQFPENISYAALFSDSQLLQAQLLTKLAQPAAAIALCQQVEQRLAAVSANNKDPRYLIGYAKALDCQDKLESQPELMAIFRENAITGFTFN